MSSLVIVTFDLHGASPDLYLKVKKKLSRLNLQNEITSKKSGVPTRLPANTFVAKYVGNNSNASHLRDVFRKRVKKLIKDEGLKAKIFVAVGEIWAWGKSSV